MTDASSFPSGIVGLAGRDSAADEPAPRSAEFRLSGVRLPLISPARMYVCGITPYDVTHLGHAATFVWADAVESVLRAVGVQTISCRNVTDVDDVLTAAALATGRHYDEFAVYQEFLFEQDMAALRVRRPAHAPRARHFIPHAIQLAAALLTAGHAYEVDGTVFFRGAAAVKHAELSPDLALAQSDEFGDDPADPLREDPFDVPVWRRSDAEHPAWPSPWGWGRPGWHAECAAMALSTIGAGVDILAGGRDLAFPHHAYQAAMVEAATSVRPFARSTLHVGTVHFDGHKMAKSTGNLVLVSDLLRTHPAAAVRLLLLNRPWGQDWEYRPDDLDRAAAEIDGLHAAAARRPGSPHAAEAVTAALLNDLNIPAAVGVANEEGGLAARALLHMLSLS